MLGQPVSMLIPEVVGFKLHGKLPPGATATDLVLTVHRDAAQEEGRRKVRRVLRQRALVALPLADRATIANMAPEYGATMGFFPVDAETLKYLRLIGPQRAARRARRGVHARRRASSAPTTRPIRCSPTRSSSTSRRSSRASPGPKRPQDRVPLTQAKQMYREALDGRSREARDARAATRGAKQATDVAASPRARRRRDGRRSPRSRPRRARGVPVEMQRRDVHAAARRGGHRGDHELHEHVEPERDARRRPARAEGGGEGAQRRSRG